MDTTRIDGRSSTISQGDAFVKMAVSNSLEHYGVKGMKWGVRKDRYERKAQRSQKKAERREKSAKKYEARASRMQTELNKSLTKRQTRQRRDIQKDLEKGISQNLNDAQLKREGKRTTREKKQIRAAAFIATAVAVKLTADALNSGDARRYFIKGKEFITKQKFDFNKNESLADSNLNVEDIQERIVKKINPNYGAPGTKVNCRRATFAYEMNRRGYDVSATRTTSGAGQTKIGMKYALSPESREHRTGKFASIAKIIDTQRSTPKDPKFSQMFKWSDSGQNPINIQSQVDGVGKAKNIFQTLSNQPNGSRGEFGMVWGPGGGHSMSYEIIKGKVTIFDNQSGITYSSPESLSKLAAQMSTAGFTRLDDLPLNQDYLKKWLKNSK